MKKEYIYSFIAVAIATAVGLVTFNHKNHLGLGRMQDPPEKNSAAAEGAVPPLNSPNGNGGRSGEVRHFAYKLPASVKLPGGNLRSNLPDLEARAMAGNPKIAYALSMDLFSCALKSQEDGDAFLSDPSTTFGEKCKGLTDGDYAKAVNLLSYAAENGDVNAQNAYMGELALWMRKHPELKYKQDFLSTYTTNSLNYLRRAAESGNVNAMVQLAQVYDAGVITNRDAATAYAYMYATNKTGLVPSSQRMLTYWQGQFTPQEISNGISAGDQIYRECCSK